MKRIIAFFVAILAGLAVAYANSNEGRFGVCSHPFAPREINVRPMLFDKMSEAGVQWLRTDFAWAIIERKKGSFDFKVYDEIVDATAQKNIKMLGILTAGTYKRTAKDNTDDWVNYIKTTVAHFKGRVDHWEIINEHDMHEPYKENPELYGKHLKLAYDAIKEVNPKAVVLYGGLAHAQKGDYVCKSLKVAGNPSYDIMNFHAYPAPNPTELRQEKCLDNLKKAMREAGNEKPIWLTEIGSTTPPYSNESFKIIKAALKKLDLKNPKVYALVETYSDPTKLARDLFPKAKKIHSIGYDKIETLPANAVLVLPLSQDFPYQYADALVNFIAEGGTLIYQGGGFPLYFNTSNNNKASGARLINRFHADIKPHWRYEQKIPSFVSGKEAYLAEGIEGFTKDDLKQTRYRCFNYQNTKLAEGDELIPLVQAKVKGEVFNVAALYKFNSDIKGNFISISTYEGAFVTERMQAAFLARDYIYAFSQGIEKVFKYNFRSHEEVSTYEGHFGMVRKDFTKKPAFYAFKTLIKLLGNDAKPKYSEKDGTCRAEWISPEGKKVTALWRLKNDKLEVELEMDKGKFTILNVRGKSLYESEGSCSEKVFVKINAAPTYIIGARVKSISFKK